jgi:hypothetical protein
MNMLMSVKRIVMLQMRHTVGNIWRMHFIIQGTIAITEGTELLSFRVRLPSIICEAFVNNQVTYLLSSLSEHSAHRNTTTTAQ